MRRYHRWLLLAGALLAATVLTVPVVTGFYLARAMAAGAFAIAPGVTLRVAAFHRGWWHSSARWLLLADDGALPPLGLRTRFQQGPFGHGDGWWPLTAGTRIDPASVWCGWLLAPCRAVRLDSRLGWDGASQHRLQAATLTLEPPLTPVPLTLRHLQSRLALAADRHTSHLRLRADRLDLTGIPPALHDLDLRLDTRRHGRLAAGQLQLALTLPAGTAYPTGRLRLTLAARRIDNDRLRQLLRQPTFYSLTALLSGQQLLARHPGLRVHGHWQTGQGTLQLVAQARLRPLDGLRLLLGRSGPLAIIAHASGELRADRAVLEPLLAWWLGRRLAPAAAQTRARRLLARWRQAGFVSLENDVYHCRFVIEDARLVLNGITVESAS